MKSLNLTRPVATAILSVLMMTFAPAGHAQSASAFVASGLEKSKTGNYDAAIADYTKALELNSSFLSAYLNRGRAKTNQGNFDGAVADFSQAAKLRPNDADAYFERGHAEFLQGNFEGAQTDFTKAIEIKPEDQAYYERGLTRECQSNFAGALADYVKAAGITAGDDPSSYAALHAALLNRRMGHKIEGHLNASSTWSNAWTKSLAAFVSGGLSEADLFRLVAATEGDVRDVEGTEALFFVGMSQLIGGNKPAAKADFQKAFDESGPASIIHRLARIELDRP